MELNNPTFITYFFFIIFIIVFIINYVLDAIKIKKKKFDNIMIMSYVIKKFKLNKDKINYKKELKWTVLINSFIIAGVGTFVSFINTYIILQLGIGFVLLLLLIYSLYEIYGRHLVKKIRREEE